MTQGKANVALLTIDTLRPDALGCYGYRRVPTPNLNRLAASGIRFEQAISAGAWTQAAFPALFTSTYGLMHGGCRGRLSEQRPSAVEQMARHGYRTGGFSSSPLLGRDYGYARGFHHFEDLVPTESDPALRRIKGGQSLLRSRFTHYAARLAGKHLRPARLYVSAAELTNRVCRWLDQAAAPFFLWVHYMDTHWPYHVEETLMDADAAAQAWRDLAYLDSARWGGGKVTAAQRDHYVDLYLTAVSYLDSHVGRLLNHIEQSSGSDTAIVVCSDHGEEFLDHGRWGHLEDNLHEEILRIPLIVRPPGWNGGQVVSRQVRALDVMPTVLDLCGCPAPNDLIGRSLRPLWTAAEREYDVQEVISEGWRRTHPVVSVRTDEFKYICDTADSERAQLFDLREDPGEQRNALALHPRETERLQSIVDAHLSMVAETASAEGATAPDLGEDVIKRLRDLGYVE